MRRRRGEVQSSKFEVRRKTRPGRYTISWRSDSAGGASIGARVRLAVRAALKRLVVRSARVDVVGVSDKQMALLNETQLNHRGPTDVLTFDLSEGDGRLEGEIVLSLDTARREAVRRGHSVASEAALYAVHGVLHLLGFDDHTPRGASKMHRMEDEILESIGAGAVYSRPLKGRRR